MTSKPEFVSGRAGHYKRFYPELILVLLLVAFATMIFSMINEPPSPWGYILLAVAVLSFAGAIIIDVADEIVSKQWIWEDWEPK